MTNAEVRDKNKSFLKTECEGELQISVSNLFHSLNADRKKELRKKLFLTLN